MKQNQYPEAIEKQRIEYLDIFRAFGIIFMVFCHSGVLDIVHDFVYAFHMPMFFFVSGMLFRVYEKSDFSHFVKKRIRTLLMPYFIFGILFYFLDRLLDGSAITWEGFGHVFFVNSEGMALGVALWFLTASFISQMIYFLLNVYVRNLFVQTVLVTGIALFGCLAPSILPFRLPWSMDAGMTGAGFLHMGYLFQNVMRTDIRRRLLSLRWYVCFALSAALVVLAHLNGGINMRTGQYSNIPLFWLNAAIGILIMLNLSRWLEEKLPWPKIIRAISFIGENSIVFLCFNICVIFCVRKIIGSETLPQDFLVAAISIVLLWIAAWIISKTKLRVIFGR